jgi:serine/threonine protein phosphatase 1
MSLFKRLRPRSSPDPFDFPLLPDAPFYAIGDVHGCEGLLANLLDQIEKREHSGTPRIIFVGDYVDRGEGSALTLKWLYALSTVPDLTVVCLMGNHEDMMIKFMDDPKEHGARWLRYGGLQTLDSFGIRGISQSSTDAAMVKARNSLRAKMDKGMEDWLRALPVFWQSGNIAVVHAGADPAIPLDRQEPRNLKWGHKDFATQPRADGIWIIHGHTIVDDACVEDGRISIDTGAYATGRLTAAYISENCIRFIEAKDT